MIYIKNIKSYPIYYTGKIKYVHIIINSGKIAYYYW